MPGIVYQGEYVFEAPLAARLGADGWLDFLPMSGQVVQYLDPVDGLDTNDGLTPVTPRRTLWGVLSNYLPAYLPRCLRVRVKAGTTIKMSNSVGANAQAFGEYEVDNMMHQGIDENRRLIFEPYGTHSSGKFTIESNDVGARAVILQGDISYVTFRSVRFTTPPSGVSNVKIRQTFNVKHIIWHDCHFEKGLGGAAIEGVTERQVNTVFWRCTFSDHCNIADVGGDSSGVFVGGFHNGVLFHQCVFGYCGWNRFVPSASSGRTIRNHNVYCNSPACNVMFRECVTAFASATGIQARGNNTTVSNCTAIYNPINLSMGHAGPPHSNTIDFSATQTWLAANPSVDLEISLSANQSMYAYSPGCRLYVRGTTCGAGSLRYNPATEAYDIPITSLDGLWENDDATVLADGTKVRLRARVTSFTATVGVVADPWGGIGSRSIYFDPTAFMCTGRSEYNIAYGGDDISGSNPRGWGFSINRSVSAVVRRNIAMLASSGGQAKGLYSETDPYVGVDPLVPTEQDANFGFTVENIVVLNWAGTSNGGVAQHIDRELTRFEQIKDSHFIADNAAVAAIASTVGDGGPPNSYTNNTYSRTGGTSNIDSAWFKRGVSFVSLATVEGERGVENYSAPPAWAAALAAKTMISYLALQGVNTAGMTDKDACHEFWERSRNMGDPEFGGPGYPTAFTAAAFNAWVREAVNSPLGWTEPVPGTTQVPFAPTYVRSTYTSTHFIIDFVPPPGTGLEYVMEFSVDIDNVSHNQQFGSSRPYALTLDGAWLADHPSLSAEGLKRLTIPRVSLPASHRLGEPNPDYGYFQLFARSATGDGNRSALHKYYNPQTTNRVLAGLSLA